ncbi:TRAP transporter substrate-binding protein DctP [Microbacterium sp. CPCC 204701]|uniref:TRAP transporter substrate-binding protein DctP n=1 Tax=Microbacterium sp. CPCC 204701 TaxID=2493084 RepID=UPI000FD75523|nr:TRAP transporter substrate-binding protein DctP [Microbacterium sp. CPCC 204701]
MRKNTKVRIGAMGVVAAMLILAGCGSADSADSGSGGESEAHTLKVQEIFAPGEAFADSTQAFGDAVTEATHGSVSFEYFWSNAVVPTNEIAGAMNDGLLDMGRIQPPASPADFPTMNWLSSASSLNTQAFPAGLLQKIGAHLEFVMNSETGSAQLDSELRNLGIQYIGAFALVQQYDLFCSKPVASLDDFAGLKVRVAGQAWVDEIENLGGEPVTLLPEEIYEGFQRGIVDCVMTYPTHYINSGLWELGGYYVPLKLNGWNQDGLTISNAAWKSLDESQQVAMYDAVKDWLRVFVGRQLDGYWRFMTEGREQHGIEYLEPDSEIQERIDEHHDAVIESLAETAPEGVADPEAIVEEYVALHDKWLGTIEELGFDVEGDGVNDFLAALEDPDVPPSEQIDLEPWLDAIIAAAYENN